MELELMCEYVMNSILSLSRGSEGQRTFLLL